MHSMLLQRISGSQAAIAAALGVSESTISRAKNEQAELILQIERQAKYRLDAQAELKRRGVQW